MGKLEKALEKLRQNPKNVRFEELDTILRSYGFECRQPGSGSSHYKYILKIGPRSYPPLTVPYQRPLKAVYVKNVLKFIDQFLTDVEDNED